MHTNEICRTCKTLFEVLNELFAWISSR